MVKLRHFTLFFAALCALALGAPPKASAYNLIVVGDTNLFPFDTANPGDIGGMVDCYNGLAVCPPGCNQNLFPFDTCNAGDIGFMVDYLNGGPLSFFPGGGYVNFTSDPGNPPSPVAGTNSFGVIVDMVSTATNLSGFDNVKGVLGVRAEIIADVGGGASITPPAAALAPSGPGLQVGTGSKAQGAASVDLTCGADGDVTIRFYVPAYSHIVGAGEHCAGGAACAPGEHMDQIDIVVTCGGGPVDPCTAPLPDGTVCGRVPSECDGGETCLAGACTDNGFVAAGSACGDTGVECLVDDTCDGAGACTDNGLEADGTACGDPSVTSCDLADQCLAGVCDANPAPAGSACGDTGVECLVDDTCDGAGACTDNGLEADGTACGDPSVTECDLADTCSAGACVVNNVAAGSACGDTGVECLVNDTCDGAGACTDNGLEPDGTACGDPSVTSCDLADQCLAGVCDANPVGAGAPCGDQGVECLVDDTCDGAGACADNGFEPAATACGDPSNTECTNPDSCDGGGVCLPNDEAAGFACGDQGVECLVNDSCDGGGTCVDAGLEADGTACGDPSVTQCDLADTCAAGSCVANPVAAGSPCGDTGVECLVDDTCDGAGACTDNGNVADGTSCTDDLLFCSGPETCTAGLCTSDGDPCAPAPCDEGLDACIGEICNDGIDNDGDLLADCADPDCPDGSGCLGNGAGECSAADTCLAGVCEDNDLGAGSACGDTGVECLVNDTCDGAGSCTDNGFDDGASCTTGNGVSACSAADTCSAGACLDNDLAAGSACGDTGVECLVDDTCDGAGTCTDNGLEADGTACGDPSVTECDLADTCTAGACVANPVAAGSACGDTGVECLVDDTCDGAGLCTDNGFEAAATPCGDPSNTECTNPDTCDGGGTCLVNDEAAGFACGDQGVDCLVNDACDGAGACTDNGLEPDGTLCTDNGAFCDGVEECQAAACISPGDPCVAPTPNCNETADVCEAGVCDGTPSAPACTFDSDCTNAATGGVCPIDDPIDCQDNVCIGGGGESEIGICSEQPGLVDAVCLATSCSADSQAEGTSVGADCVDRNNGAHTFGVTFNTQATSGTLFTIWARILLDSDWDGGEQYNCSLDGVTGVGTVNWSYTEAGMIGGANGPGCAAATADGDMCWAAANDSAQIALDAGPHVFTCTGITNSNNEWTGFDGLIFTTNAAYIPDFQDTACGDDASFQAGTCFGNWGPSNYNSGAGFCAEAQPGDAGATCNPDAGECDVAEVCDGLVASCPADSFEPVGTVCGTPGVECFVDDTCDGAGVCVDNGFDDGAACSTGNGASACSGADTCLAGACLDNDLAAGSPCGDQGVECLVDDACDGAGLCTDNGAQPAGTLCGAALTEPTCDPDSCDGAGACADAAAQPDDSPCADNGGDFCCVAVCTNTGGAGCNPDVCGDGAVTGAEQCDPAAPQSDPCCDPGTCQWAAAGTPDPVCAAADDCNDDLCDGGGGCALFPLADGTPCVGNGAGDCSAADTCLVGACLDNDFAAGTLCGAGLTEPTCDPDSCDGLGTCTDAAAQPDDSPCADNGGDFCCVAVCTNTGGAGCSPDVCGDGAVTGAEQCDPAAPQSDICCDPGTCQWAAAGTPDAACAAGDECNVDSCNGAGACALSPVADGTSCTGNGAGECTGADTCLAGTCSDNDFAVGSPCGDTGVECLVNDTCDGVGACTDNGFDDGASCTGNGAGECSGADTCSGGACLDNDLAAGSPCGDQGVECLVNDACDGANVCVDGGFDDGASCAGNGVGSCTAADTCSGGACLDNDLADGTVCAGAAGLCDLDDTCLAGACSDNGVEPNGTLCRVDGDGTDCDAAEFCDGASPTCPADICEANGTGCTGGGTCDASCVCQPPVAGTCLDCHNQNTAAIGGTLHDRRQIIGGDSALAFQHISKAKNEFDCVMCHTEGDASAVPTGDHMNGVVDLRGADSGTSIAVYDDTDNLGSVDVSVLTPFCLGCHDADGYSDNFLSSVNGNDGSVTRSALDPFGHGISPLNIDALFDNAGAFSTHSIAGRQRYAAVGDELRPNESVSVPAAAWVGSWGWTSTTECGDCHLPGNLSGGQPYTNNAHATANHPYNGQASNDLDDPYIDTDNAASNAICFKCHDQNTYQSGTNDTRYPDHSKSAHMSGADNVFGIGCLNCHGGYTAGGIHGVDYTRTDDDGLGTYEPRRFTNGASLDFWSEALSGKSGDTRSCSAWQDTASGNNLGCTQHGAGGNTYGTNFQ